MNRSQWEYPVLVEWQGRISEAARAFEARWTESALRRLDAALYARFQKQRELFDAALVSGSTEEVATQGAAMVRGYVAVVAAMQAAGAPDDAYQIGSDSKSGLTVAIGPKPCCKRVQELYGDSVQWFSPDEVATMVAIDARLKALADFKRVFPGAEVSTWGAMQRDLGSTRQNEAKECASAPLGSSEAGATCGSRRSAT